LKFAWVPILPFATGTSPASVQRGQPSSGVQSGQSPLIPKPVAQADIPLRPWRPTWTKFLIVIWHSVAICNGARQHYDEILHAATHFASAPKEVIFFCGRSAILTLDARDDAQEAPDTSMPLCVFESPTS
jgi:hypothetical protein